MQILPRKFIVPAIATVIAVAFGVFLHRAYEANHWVLVVHQDGYHSSSNSIFPFALDKDSCLAGAARFSAPTRHASCRHRQTRQLAEMSGT